MLNKLCSHILPYFILGLALFTSNCSGHSPKEQSESEISQMNSSLEPELAPKQDSLVFIEVAGHKVDIINLSGGSRGNLLVLPGWDFPRQDWCEKSSLCKRAVEEGYCLILPEMGKSVYSTRFYPETRSDWKVFPTKTWLTDSLIPNLQKEYNILLKEQKNYILGLSTGGRGVALIALARPDLFKAVAALSGDFDQTKMPSDRLMIGYYGTYQNYPERWEGEDNPTRQAQQWKTPIYLGHGQQDNIVPYEQTETFYQAIRKQLPDSLIQIHLKSAKHDYVYWDSEVDPVLHFFNNF